MNTPLIPEDASLDQTPLALLEAETTRLQKLISGDRATAEKFTAVSRRITEETSALAKLESKLADFERTKDRASDLVQQREAGYVRVFKQVLAEQRVLLDLYAPLAERVKKGKEHSKSCRSTCAE